MTLENTLTTIKRDLIRAFAVLDGWFDKDDAFHHYKPPGKDLFVRDLLERVALTGCYMMTLARSGDTQLLKLTTETNATGKSGTVFDDAAVAQFLKEIRTEKCFQLSAKSLHELRAELRDQLHTCLCYLDLLSYGDEVLYRTRFPGLSKGDLHQCMNLIALHVWQYVKLLEEIEGEYDC
jgi:hypothetical protein